MNEGLQDDGAGGVDAEVTSGGIEAPVEPCRSGHVQRAPIQDDNMRYSNSSYNRVSQLEDQDNEPVGASYAYMAHHNVPCTYQDAMNQPNSNSWLEACQDELHSLQETRTYVPVSTDDIETHNIVDSRWVFAVKSGPNGSVEQYKARIVMKGFSQVYHIDYEETFTPVAKWVSIRILLAIAMRLDLEVHQMDIKMAFLNSDLEHSIYMRPPPGSLDYGSQKMVWKLKKSLYGLKQVSHAWYQKAKVEFEKIGFTQCYSDYPVFIYMNSCKFCIIALYVDDLMVLSNDAKVLKEKKRDLMNFFRMKDLGPIHWFLSLEIIQD